MNWRYYAPVDVMSKSIALATWPHEAHIAAPAIIRFPLILTAHSLTNEIKKIENLETVKLLVLNRRMYLLRQSDK